MFASVKINAFFTSLIMMGCWYSPEFAASVVAGALGSFLAAVVIFGINAGNNPVTAVLRKSKQLVGL